MQSVEHVLKPMGLPYAITTSPKLSLQHDLALFFPEAEPGSFDDVELESIDTYLEQGGTLIAKASSVQKLRDVGGISKVTFGAYHTRVHLTAAGKLEFPSLDHPNEQSIPLGGTAAEHLNTWGLTVRAGTTVLATFEDGTPAIAKRVVGTGVVSTMGLDYRDVVLRNQIGNDLNAARSYINDFEPATDTWMLMVRDIWDARVEFGVRLHPSPNGTRGALLLSHDLDWGKSYDNGVFYAEEEKKRGASSTFFVHTKVVADIQDAAFFTPDRIPIAARLLALGSTIGSHTVAHSPMLDVFPIGTGTETYPSYRPYNVSRTSTTGGTVFGEGRVSKSLIDGALAVCGIEHDVTAFRAGELSYNPALPQVLERMGYRIDSSRAVGDVLANFPFRITTSWPGAFDTSMFEFPVTLEDELSPRLDTRVDAMRDVIEANAKNGAPTTLLIHPNVLDYKLIAEQELITTLPEGVVAMGMGPFGDFWRARDAASIDDIRHDPLAKTLTVVITTPLAVDGLTLRARGVTGVTSPAGARFVARASTDDGWAVLPSLAAGATTTIVMTTAH